MTNRLPTLKGREIIRVLIGLGFIEKRSTGSHVILKNPKTGRMVVVPLHGGRDVKRGTLFAIIKQAGLTVEEFNKFV